MKPTSILKIVVLFLTATVLFGFSYRSYQKATAEPSIKQILLTQLKSTHSKKEWFVCANIAVDGLTPEQAMWKDKSGNHSVGQLAYHLIFWNERELVKFKGKKAVEFDGNNETTFNNVFTKDSWAETVKKLDQVMTDWENAVEAADDAKLKDWYGTIANVSTHNAYHVGQMVFVRKQQNAWDPEKGVK